MADEAGGSGVVRELLASYGIKVDTRELDTARRKLRGFLNTVKQVSSQMGSQTAKINTKMAAAMTPKVAGAPGGTGARGIFGIGNDARNAINEAQGGLGGIIRVAQVAAGALAAVFATKAVFDFANATTDAILQLRNMALTLNLTTDKLQALKFASESTGVEFDTLTMFMMRLEAAQGAAKKGTGETAKAFSKLGISLQGIDKIPVEDMLSKINDGLSKLSHNEGLDALRKIGGRGASRVIPLFSEGKEGLQGLLDVYQKLGGGFSADAEKKARAFRMETTKLDLVLAGLKSRVFEQIIPGLGKLVGWFREAVGWISKMTKGTEFFKVALTVLAGALSYFAYAALAALWPILAPVLAISAAFLGLVLILEDIAGFFSGKNSAIGHWIDDLFGPGSQQKVRDFAKDFKKSISEFFSNDMATNFENMFNALDAILEKHIAKWKTEIKDAMTPEWVKEEDRKQAEDEVSAARKRPRLAPGEWGFTGTPRAYAAIDADAHMSGGRSIPGTASNNGASIGPVTVTVHESHDPARTQKAVSDGLAGAFRDAVNKIPNRSHP